MPAIFISHSSLDQKAADDIKTALDRLGFEQVFLDFDKTTGIGAGENWEKRLYAELSRCHAVILVLTPNWLDSKWCFAELAQARALGKVILPIICAPLGQRVVLPEIQSVDMIDWNPDGIARLAKSLHAITDELARGFTLPPGRPIFPGIHAFEAEDAAIYFGRDDETRDVIERLDARRTRGGARMIVIIGASGSGKSSLLKAGVLPQLARRRTHWLMLPTMRPEKAPMEALAKSIAEFAGAPAAWSDWLAKLNGPNAADEIETLLKNARIGEARGATALLPIDQFEEVFTVASAAERAAFLQLLSVALDPARDLPLMVIATGRSDVLEGLIETGKLARLFETFPLATMPIERVPRLLEGPAMVAGIHVERGLSERIAKDLESAEALPLLAQTLALLYERRGTDKQLTVAKYLALGDAKLGLNPIQNSVRLVADEFVDALKPTEAQFSALRDAFIPHLVRVRIDDGKRVRQPAKLSELPEESRPLILELVKVRLLSMRGAEPGDHQSEAGGAIVEVAHEALFRAWPMLDRWLTEEHGFLTDIEHIRNAREIWALAPVEQKSAALLYGFLLARARDWLIKYPRRFLGGDMELVRAFIAESAAAEDAERERTAAQRARTRRMERALLYGAIAAAVVFAGASLLVGSLYFEAEGARAAANLQRRVAVAREIFARSRVEEQNNNECSLDLALAAYDVAHRTSAVEMLPFETAIRDTLAASHVVATLPATVQSAKVSTFDIFSWDPEGKRIAYIDRNNQVAIWSPDAPGKPRVIAAIKNPEGVRWRPGTGELSILRGGTIELWRVDGTAPVKTLSTQAPALSALRWDKDGKRALVWSLRQGTLLVDAQTGAVQPLTPPTNVWRGYAWSPDGKQVAAGARSREVWVINLEQRTFHRSVHPVPVSGVAWSPRGDVIAVGLDNGQVWLWNAETGARLDSLDGHTNQVYSGDFTPDGRQFLSASWDHSLRIWDTQTWRSTMRLTAHTAGVLAAQWNATGKFIASSGTDGTVRIWSPRGGRNPQTWLETTGWVWSVGWSADGKILAAAADNELVMQTGRAPPRQIARAQLKIKSGSWARTRPLYAYADDAGLVVVMDAETNKIVMEKRTERAQYFSVALSADGSLVAVSSDKGVFVWSVPDGKLEKQFEILAVALAFSPKGKLLAYVPADKSTVNFFDFATGKARTPLEGLVAYKATWGLAWSDDGSRIAAASDDDLVRVWTLSAPDKPLVLVGHSGDAKGVAWNRTGDRLASTALDGTAIIWAIPSGKQIAVLTGNTSGVRSPAFSPDGKTLATAGEDGTVRLYSTDFADVLNSARAQEKVGLTPAERTQCLRDVAGEISSAGR
jgi:WD40 repeat protein